MPLDVFLEKWSTLCCRYLLLTLLLVLRLSYAWPPAALLTSTLSYPTESIPAPDTEDGETHEITYNETHDSALLIRGSRMPRIKRDETEHTSGAYGRGIGFFVGEPCQEQCNAILFHIYCNKTTRRCECLSEYPVNIDTRICVKALRLGESCEYHESCKHYDVHASCQAEEGKCRCESGYYPKIEDLKGSLCVPGRSVYGFADNSDILTMISVVAGLVAFVILLCVVLKMFSKARFGDASRDRYANAGAPPPSVILTGLDQATSVLSSRRPSSIRSVSNEFLPPSRRASYSMLAPPCSNLASRRPSSSSVRSQSSFRSYSSFRSQSSFRNYRGTCGGRELVHRTPSSPTTAPTPAPTPRSPSSSRRHVDQSRSYATNHCSPVKPDKTEKCAIHSSLGVNPGA